MSKNKNILLEKFSYRHIGANDQDQYYMLNELGYKSINSFCNITSKRNL